MSCRGAITTSTVEMSAAKLGQQGVQVVDGVPVFKLLNQSDRQHCFVRCYGPDAVRLFGSATDADAMGGYTLAPGDPPLELWTASELWATLDPGGAGFTTVELLIERAI